MGNFFGSVQVKTDDREQVRRAAEAIASERGIKCYLGPLLKGWVGIYPQDNGQDASVGEAIAQQLSQPVLHLLVHDDDIFAYQLWRAGEQLDSYWSKPGYFDEGEREEQEHLPGNAEVIAQVFDCKVDALRELLRRDEPLIFEYERLQQFADLLRIPNALTAYEYLQAGERDGVRGWRQFEELPAAAISDAKTAKQQQRKEMTAQRKQLQKAGLLLAEKKYKGFGVTACPGEVESFVVLWNHYANQGGFELWRAPWDTPNRSALQVESIPVAATTSRDGQWVAYSMATHVEVQRVADGRRLLRHEGRSGVLAFAADGRQLAIAEYGNRPAGAERTEIRLIDLADGQFSTCAKTAEATQLSFSPDGKMLIGVGADLLFVPLGDAGQTVRRFVGGQALPATYPAAFLQAMNVDYSQVERNLETTFEKALEQMTRMWQSLKGKLSDEELARMTAEAKANIQEQLESSKQHYADLKSGKLPAAAPLGRERPFKVGFAMDGRWFWCTTDKGLRVYDWQAVLTAGENMPPTTYEFEPKGESEFSQHLSYIYSAGEVSGDDALVFGGLSEVLYRMSLTTGEVSELLRPPEGGAIMQVAVTVDGKSLGLATRPGFPDSRGDPSKQSTVWQVWSCSKLLEKLDAKS
jgi:hypothetical protein